MVNIRPFKALRPIKNLAEKVASLPYDVLNSDEARELGDSNKYSFLHIDKAEIDLSKDISPYDPAVYQKAADNLEQFELEGWLGREANPAFYIYQLTMDGRSQTGLVVCTSIDDYTEGKIKKHELTREEKELDRIRHVDVCDANTSPIFLTYRGKEAINALVDSWVKENEPEYDFESFHGVEHKVWAITDSYILEDLSAAFKEVPALYIADGHHRTESAVKVGLKRRAEYPDAGPEAEFNFFLSVVFPEEQLEILDYNRVVNAPIEADFLDKISANFDLEKIGEKAFKPEEPKQVGMYLDGSWYKLVAKTDVIPNDVIGQLDVSILLEQILTPIFGIEDIRRDNRIDFVGGIRGLSELERLVDSGSHSVAFAMYPPTMDDLLGVADASEIMPPKSTWFEPKLLSGLFVHDLESK
ncbi:DUF1015 domain-containing protein [Listeria seeligeri]|uniref:DUF1015 domain-containing protein n=1 Tax=Listeria seeligeri TaxID=1640 RepID=UPI0010D753E2|nr:DUF1015 domain-containing protein [Listeria seeligeri]